MILGKVRIQNFKSIIDTGWVYLSKGDLVNILAGQNESGKTSFLSALRFFEEGNYETFEEEDRRMETSPEVNCTFYLTDAEYNKLKSDTNTEIADYVKRNGINFLRGDEDGGEDDFIERYSYPEELKAMVNKFNESVAVAVEGEENEGKKFQVFKYFQEIKPSMVFYSSFIDKNLPGKATKADVLKNQAIIDFQAVYDVDFSDLMDPSTTDKKRRSEEERIRREAANSLNKYWNQIISGEQVEYKYAITINSQQTNPELSSVNFYINQGDDAQLSISQKSQGFQWFSGFNLRLRAHEAELEDKGLILLIDEPGQGLHEVAQQDVKNVIEELARESKVQIIYSTHQPILLGKNSIDFSRLLLVDRSKEKGSMFKTVSQLVSSNGSLDSLAPIRTAMGMVTLTDPISQKVTVVTEGITEYYIVKAILGDDYTILPSCGVDQVPNLFGILLGWGVSTKVLLDDDTQGKKSFNKIKKGFFNDLESDEFKRRVYKPTDFTGIEDFLSIPVITEILADYEKQYLPNKSKVENVEQVGKFIFAKSFFDKFSGHAELLDTESTTNFANLTTFLQS